MTIARYLIFYKNAFITFYIKIRGTIQFWLFGQIDLQKISDLFEENRNIFGAKLLETEQLQIRYYFTVPIF